VIGQELERDWLAQLQIVGAIDFTHSAFTEQPNDPVTLGEHLAGHKTRIID